MHKEIIKRKEILIDIPVTKSGFCLGIITWIKINLYKHICLENNPKNHQKSHWINPLYTFNKPLKLTKGSTIKVKASLLEDKVWFDLIE